MKVFQETFSNIMKDKFTKGADNFQANKSASNKTYGEIYEIEKKEKFTN